MKRFALVFLVVFMIFFQTGCEVASNGEVMVYATNGRFAAVPNEQDLYYDIQTNVVYVMFRRGISDSSTGYMSPYYANNGLPYLYNSETNSMEENSWSKISGFENWFKH